MKKNTLIIIAAWVLLPCIQAQVSKADLYNVETNLKSRSITFENPSGAPGEGGKAANRNLGVGRKGAPARSIKPGETVVLCDIQNSGTIRRIWMTGTYIRQNFLAEDSEGDRNLMLRSTIIRAYWDGQEHPSIECPLGDFMGLAHGKVTSYESAVHNVGENAAFTFWLPMPFLSNAKITITNEADKAFTLFYQIDYTVEDKHPENVGRLHTCFLRQNPTVMKEDFEILPKRTGKGRFIGTVLGVRTLHPKWWGEGEVKFFMDGDDEFPTLCGTGAEDYVGLSYGIQQTTFLYQGANLVFTSDTTVQALDLQSNEFVPMKREFISMYRWHLPDPVFWEKECRVTIQQIGCCNPLFERQDDWSAATFWYESVPSAPLPKLVPLNERIADIDELF
jgi:hypothetical protein